MSKRKTLSIDTLKAMINDRLLHTPDALKESRAALASLLSQVLHNCGVYRGFGYLSKFDMAASQHGYSVGINSAEEGALEYPQRFAGTDDTRRHYY